MLVDPENADQEGDHNDPAATADETAEDACEKTDKKAHRGFVVSRSSSE